jgi:hypothetical protein
MDVESMVRLSDEAGFVFRGRVVARAPDEAPVSTADKARTLSVTVEEVLRGTDVTRDLVGRTVYVVSDEAERTDDGARHVFFTNCVSLGEQVLTQELGRHGASDEARDEVAETVRVAEELPLAERILGADLIVTGVVTDSRPLDKPFPPRSEHDPEWWVARVAVDTVVKGRTNRKTVDVLFANSVDIAWYQSPKLYEGMSGVLLLRSARGEDVPEQLPRAAYQATHPLDFIETHRLVDIRAVIERDAGEG